MAELSTIARPYAQGLWKAMVERGTTAQADQMADVLNVLSEVSRNSQVAELVNDPKITDEELYKVITGTLGQALPDQLPGLLRTVIENGRLNALPEIAAQFHALKNESEGVADAYIETAYVLTKKEVELLLKSLSKKFPGKKLNPIVTINKSLIGGVSIRVGDQVLDGSVRARLAQMQQALTA